MGKEGLLAVAMLAAASASFSSDGQPGFPETWGNDGCLYVANGTVWSNTMWCRKFPDDGDANVWDLYNAQGIPIYRFTNDDSGWIQMYQHQSQLTYLVPDRNSVFSAMAAVGDYSKVRVLWPDDRRLNPMAMTGVEYMQLHAAVRSGVSELRDLGPECLRGTEPYTVRYSIPADVECQTEAERMRMFELASRQVGAPASQEQRDASRRACQAELASGAYDATGQRRPGAYDAGGNAVLPPENCQ